MQQLLNEAKVEYNQTLPSGAIYKIKQISNQVSITLERKVAKPQITYYEPNVEFAENYNYQNFNIIEYYFFILTLFFIIVAPTN